jgi:hypothetical protein
MNPTIVAGGPGQPVVADFVLEGRKAVSPAATLRITRDLT